MSLKKCPYCAEEILIEAIKCKHCGSNLSAEVKGNKSGDVVAVKKISGLKIFGLVMLIPLAIFVLFAVIGANDPVLEERRLDREAIATCKNELNKYPILSGEYNMLNGACTELENRFRIKYEMNP